MAKRYPFVKRYGLEGAESMIVAMDTIFRSASQCTRRRRLHIKRTTGLDAIRWPTCFQPLQNQPKSPTSCWACRTAAG